jgi:SAM-dependent methyltransferase
MTKWLVYNDLAWTESILCSPEDYVEETELLITKINEHAKIDVKTLLHLGCGAGGNDYTFKRFFTVTGVDISECMLQIARKRNPQVNYVLGDMRRIRLEERFDAVAIPDSIGYMTTIDDLQKAILTAIAHLNPGGVLLIVAHTKEDFSVNNFVYSGKKGSIEITLFENNYFPDSEKTTYEATFVYLIRRDGVLSFHSDCHTIGVFSMATWLDLFREGGLLLVTSTTEHLYTPFILGEGEYPLSVFVCRKPMLKKVLKDEAQFQSRSLSPSMQESNWS